MSGVDLLIFCIFSSQSLSTFHIVYTIYISSSFVKKTILSPGFILDGKIEDLLPEFTANSFFNHEFCFELGLTDVNSWVSEEDFLSSLKYMVPSGCSHDFVRIGSMHNGSYLLPDILESVEACFSPGIGSVHAFEDQLANEYKIPSYMCDNTKFEDDLQLNPDFQYFIQKRLSSCSVGNSISLDDWVNNSPHCSSTNLLLQMDIEGSEYPVLLSTSRSVLSKFSILVFELHYLSLLPFRRFSNRLYCPFMEKILSLFDCVHIHPNNSVPAKTYSLPILGRSVILPSTVELTFLRKDLNPLKVPPQLPHTLDSDNDPNLPTLNLGYPWCHHL